MTALVGVLHHHGDRCDPDALGPLLDAAAHHGPGRGLLADGPAGLGWVGRTHPKPAAGEAPGPRVAFSGSLHNREELCRLLGREGRRDDAELALAAYVSWGEGCGSRLLGEFAFVVWDPARRRLVAVRDAMGTRPLFFRRAGGASIVTSELGQMAGFGGLALEPDETWLRRLLELDFEDLSRTCWRGVQRVPPAHALVLDEDGPRFVRQWSPDAGREVRRRHPEEYSEEFLSLFAEAVRCRLRGPEPIGCLFSGGVDSSAVLCMAHALSQGASAPRLEAFSMVFPAAPVDDRQFIEAVREMHGARVHYVQAPVTRPIRDLDEALGRMHGPFVDAHHAVLNALVSASAGAGCRVLLTGLRGDDIFGGLAYLADRARRLDVRSLRDELEAWSGVIGASPRALFWALCARPWLRRATPVRQVRPAAALTGPVFRRPRARAFPTLAQEEVHELALGPFTVLTTELFEMNAARHGLEPTYPFWDRRIVEFVLALPQEMRMASGVTKRVLRDAMTGVMPEPNRLRADKLSLAPFFRRGLVHEDRELLVDAVSGLHPTLASIVRPERAARALRDLLSDRPAPLLQVWLLVCANLWLRQLSV